MLLPVSLFLFPKLRELGLRGLTLPLHVYLKDTTYVYASNEDMTYDENEDLLVGLGLVGVRLRLLTYMMYM